MSIPIGLALADSPWEGDVVAALSTGRQPLTVVRRCVDIADLLAVAASGQVRAAIVSAELRRLDGDALIRLASSGVAVAVALPDDDEATERRLRQLGVRHFVSVGASVPEVVEAVLTALGDSGRTSRDYPPARPTASGQADPSVLAAPDRLAADDELSSDDHSTVIAVWGAVGSPGRTTVALNLAGELAHMRGSAVLIDADTYGACVAQLLGMLDEAPGLTAACRLATTGRLDLPALAQVAADVGGGLRVLTGITRADRWPEIRPSALEAVIGLARRLAPVVVVDVSAVLEQDEELSFDTAAPRRNGAALAALDSADVVLAVAAADPVGLQRFVRATVELREAVPEATIRPVVNRVRRGPMSGDPEQQIAAALERYAGLRDPWFLAQDLPVCDAAVASGRLLRDVAGKSALRRAIYELAGELSALAGVDA